jgi:acyl-CoA reductase-like NAD-dependent aldehyde dehydrogenase
MAHNPVGVAPEARRASLAWAAAGLARRLAVLQAAGRELAARRDELHAALRADSLSEDMARYWGDWLTRAAAPDVLQRYATWMARQVPARAGSELLVRRPDGVVLLVPPGNSPTINSSSVFSILLPGNVVIARAPENDQGMRLIFEKVLQPALLDAGFPRGVVSLVTAKSRDFLAALAPAPEVRTIVFFGNADAGRAVMAEALALGKKAVMELEGSDHLLVWKDADLDGALESAANALQGSTQPCVVPKHFLVHGAAFERFTEALVRRSVDARTVEEDPAHGLLVPVRLVDRYDAALAEVREVGEVLTGGYRMNLRREPDPAGIYVAPTVVSLTGEAALSRSLRCFEEEIAFPLFPVVRFDGPDDVVQEQMLELARRSPFGLRASLWARDPAVIARLTAGLDGVGLVLVNQDHARAPDYVSPWGGPGRSGGPFGESHFFWEKTSRLQAIACNGLSEAEVRRVLEELGAADVNPQ